MDYFLSGGGTGTIDPTIITTQEAAIPATTTVSSILGDTASQFIPSELLSFVDWPFVGIIFVRVLVIIWVLKDSTYRSSSTSFCLLSMLLVTLGTPVVGLPIYLAIRPLGYKHERNYWKTAIHNIENIDSQEQDNEEYNNDHDYDQAHIAELQHEAILAVKRTKNTLTKKSTPTSRPTPTKKLNATDQQKPIKKVSNTKKTTTTQKIPTPKKAVTRTA